MTLAGCAPVASGPQVTLDDYPTRTVEGWTVHLNPKLVTTHKRLGDEAVKLLAADLYRITRRIPPGPLQAIRRVGIYIEYENAVFKGATYHPSGRALAKRGVNPAKGRCVEITDVRNYIKWTRPYRAMALHELAHAYHHQVLGYDNRLVIEPFRSAMKRGLYDDVLNIGGGRGKAYATRSVQEYFAELTEAYFATNDYYPFVRSEIRVHDPAGFRMIERAWKVPAIAR